MLSIWQRSENTRSPLLGGFPARSPSPSRKITLPPFLQKHLGLLVAILYGIISVSITVFNKAVLSGYGFNYSNTLSLGQGICSLAFLFGLRNYKIISFPNLSWRTALEVCFATTEFLGFYRVLTHFLLHSFGG